MREVKKYKAQLNKDGSKIETGCPLQPNLGSGSILDVSLIADGLNHT